MGPIATLLLDLDDTLLDHSGRAGVLVATGEELAARHPEIEPASLVAANRSAFPGFWAEVEDDWCAGRLDADEMQRGLWAAMLASLSLDVGIADDAAATYRRLEGASTRLYDDAIPLLRRARERGVRVAVLTNGPGVSQRAKAEHAGLLEYVDAVVVSGDVGSAKPDPGCYAAALRILGAEPAGAAHVGDLLSVDVAGALAAGIGAVWLNRAGAPGDGAIRPDLEVRSLREVEALLAG
ncbi:HAD family hydrolase [Agromyces seonyuensis]|uniref:HAD-IA family hydrolase n=1 Tax=Agromyces seonyuensis TaxID=2662446 RepID=A0A6I4NW61_9MICO|nr:HAD family hydrolase [Agromyces seonyuensis]MWB98361.1 HAD-IA family hydrolase [Agromyces seonyuensis]